MYLPDWSMVKQLRAYDERLEVRWLVKKERWGIYRRIPAKNGLYDQRVLVMIVQGPEGGYRPLDLRTLWSLQQGDHHRRNRNEILREMLDSQERAHHQEQAKFRDDIQQITKEVRPAIARQADAMLGAANVPKEDLKKQFPQESYEEPPVGMSRTRRKKLQRGLKQRLRRKGFKPEAAS